MLLLLSELTEPASYFFPRILESDWVTEDQLSSLSSNPTPGSHFTNIPQYLEQESLALRASLKPVTASSYVSLIPWYWAPNPQSWGIVVFLFA